MLSSMKKTTRVFLRTFLPACVGLAVLVAIIAWLAGESSWRRSHRASRRSPPKSSGRTRRHTPSIEVTKPDVEQALGTVRAASRTVVSARVLATIEEMLVSAGDEVSEGQVLVLSVSPVRSSKHASSKPNKAWSQRKRRARLPRKCFIAPRTCASPTPSVTQIMTQAKATTGGRASSTRASGTGGYRGQGNALLRDHHCVQSRSRR